ITGITTTLGFGTFVMQHPAFTSGNFDTHFVKKYFAPGSLQNSTDDEAMIAALIMEKLLSEKKVYTAEVIGGDLKNWVKNRKEF
ncbi:MAG TPA: hypothetical protein VNX40_11965, partial [Mucilaginibacter sp.]|nr:hypothetical protein [Mucilaginibacter sp.]